jgi:hypothetical protein
MTRECNYNSKINYECSHYLYFFFLSIFYSYICVSHLPSALKKHTKGEEKEPSLSMWNMSLTYYHDCQNSSKSLLYSERSWISRFATCQFISWDCKILHTTSPAGKIHHSLSSLHTTATEGSVWNRDISPLSLQLAN